MRSRIERLFLFGSLVLAASGAWPANAQDAALQGLPATFEGDLPCADCPGIHYQLNLWPNQTFFLRLTYRERDRVFDDTGRWTIPTDAGTLVLHGESDTPTQFAIRDANALRKLDVAGREIKSALNHDLARAASFRLLGEASVPALASTVLEFTDWKLVRLADRAIDLPAGHEPGFQLQPDDHRLSGFSGCNRLTGTYQLDGMAIRFGPIAMTRMACAPEVNAVEQAFGRVFQVTATWGLVDGRLELYDATRALVASFAPRVSK